jgi:diguanylate cyclase (GGDEF)-like protein
MPLDSPPPQPRRTDALWVVAILSLVGVFVSAIAVTGWASIQHSPDQGVHAHHAAGDAHPRSHNDFFTNHGLYMPRTHCLMNQAGNPDWPWILTLIGLSLGVIAAYVRIYLFWCKSYFAEEPRDRNPRLMDLAQMFLWCAVTGYAAFVLMFFWPGYRLVAVCLLFLNLWCWRFCLKLSGFRGTFAADRYRRLHEHDPLTGLYSRAAIRQHLDERLKQTGEQSPTIAILFLDFDRFKLVNDSMGHEAGDDLLKQIAKRLDTAFDNDLLLADTRFYIGRLGGDEFIVVIDGQHEPTSVNYAAQRLHHTLASTYSIAGRAVHSSVSIGVTTTEQGYACADEMLRDADTAMYAAKQAGRGRTAWFDRSMHDAVRDAIELENDLRNAIDRDELFVVYQPLIDLADGRVTGFEALIRWRHPTRGLVRPDQFIAIAEESHLIKPIGRWILERALRQIADWRARFAEMGGAVMNVNLSRVQFADPGLTEFITDRLAELDLPPDALCLEITESTIMQDYNDSIALLHRFQQQGIKLAMDDFGTGYSSLSRLHDFPLDAIKIDRAFIANLTGNRDYAAVIHAITALAGNLGFTVVAEGVETHEQVAELQALSCHKAQGYLFHKPAEPPVIEAYLSGRQDRAASA